ncbi:N-lysine methyltransferase SMYD2 [Chlorella sorokiniana]|uniref:N-lysine methyltransferase SMYD2 n=1 Tax=Chlorella sorokiniana TaxID=3076 RepID=A0A2P6TTR2_CHLSO|nr:N-lysine methyltransferase SMYD2 [Chlorella sorokiniana]|eukprot:PRW57455.1 N-lysine methyltransferase SMYD2 [Chlorella sorokiniana]
MVRCLTNAARDVGLPRGACLTASAFQHLAPLVVATTILLCVPPDNKGFQSQLRDLVDAEWTDEDTALATALEAELRTAGIDPLLTAAEQQRLTLLLTSHAARMLEEVSLSPRLVARVRRAARCSTRRLVQLHPGSAMLKQVHAFVLSLDSSLGRQTTAAYRTALQAAEATNSHLLAAYAGYTIAFYMLHGAEGPTWPLAEVRSLVQQALRSFRLCKAWQFSDNFLLEWLKQLQRQVAEAAAARPGAERLPLVASLEDTGVPGSSPPPSCDACGQESPKLRRCAACQERAYCCRECQVDDWKRGHKAECAQLAAHRSGGS